MPIIGLVIDWFLHGVLVVNSFLYSDHLIEILFAAFPQRITLLISILVVDLSAALP